MLRSANAQTPTLKAKGMTDWKRKGERNGIREKRKRKRAETEGAET